MIDDFEERVAHAMKEYALAREVWESLDHSKCTIENIGTDCEIHNCKHMIPMNFCPSRKIGAKVGRDMVERLEKFSAKTIDLP